MIKISKQIKIGFVAIVAILLLIFGINFLKGKNLFDNNRSFYAVYSNIAGLQSGSSVFLNGFSIGVVTEISINPSNIQEIIVLVNIDQQFNIPSNSILKIVNQDLMGTKAINLVLGNSNLPASQNDTLISSIEGSLQEEVNKQIVPLKNKAEGLIGSLDSAINVIVSVLSEDARESLSNSLVSLDKTFNSLSSTMYKIDKIVEDNDQKVSEIMDNIHQNNDEITNILENLEILSIELAVMSKKINSSEGSLGLLIHNKNLYNNLDKSAKELSELIADIKKNPKRYFEVSVFGGSSN